MLDQLDYRLVVVYSSRNRDRNETMQRVVGYEDLSGGDIGANVVKYGNAWSLTVEIGARKVGRNVDLGSREFTP